MLTDSRQVVFHVLKGDEWEGVLTLTSDSAGFCVPDVGEGVHAKTLGWHQANTHENTAELLSIDGTVLRREFEFEYKQELSSRRDVVQFCTVHIFMDPDTTTFKEVDDADALAALKGKGGQ